MIDALADDLGVSTTVALLVVILAVVQIVAQLAAIVDLVRRPVNPANRNARWVWLAVILLGNLAGAVIWFAVGRAAIAPPAAVATPVEPPAGRRRTPAEVVELLYGPAPAAPGEERR